MNSVRYFRVSVQGFTPVPECEISFMPLFFRSENNFREVENLFVWKQTKFGFSYDDIAEMHRVNWHRFPYEKDIRAN
jgi:hypothetical protein